MPSSDTQFSPATGSEAVRKKTSLSRQEIKRQAGFLAGMCHKALVEMSESLSFSDEAARENAQAVAALVRSWESAVERIRICRGDPMPGSLRPEPKSKGKTKLRNLPPVPRASQPATTTGEPNA